MPTDSFEEKLKLNLIQAQCMALAALVQSSELVRQLAYNGTANDYQIRPLLHSLFQFDPEQSIDIYADLRLLEQGFNRLHQLLTRQLSKIDKDIIKYTIALLNLADELLRHKDFLNTIQTELKCLDYPSEQPWLNLPHDINTIYQATLSKLNQRIQVAGDVNHLKNDLTAARIRTLLLCGVRAAILWRQLGGSKLKLFLQRKIYQKAITELVLVNQSNE